MKRTPKYQLGYFEYDEYTSPTTEIQRWSTIDTQLKALYSFIGNGVINGMEITKGNGTSVVIASGKANVQFVAIYNQSNYILTGLVKNASNYIFAKLNDSSYWDQSVSFYSSLNNVETDDSLYVGTAVVGDVGVDTITINDRQKVGFQELVESLMSTHKHIGGINNPQPIDLSTDVQGVLNQENLPDMDASLIKSGTLDISRIPDLDHIANLTDVGTLTHNELESLISSLSTNNKNLMGETSTVNLLQLIISLLPLYPDIAKELVNNITYIPGISSDSMVDWTNTTAQVDTVNHTIKGLSAVSLNNFTSTWQYESQFDLCEKYKTYVDGDFVGLNVINSEKIIDNFSDISSWSVTTDDLSSITAGVVQDSINYIGTPPSGKIQIGGEEVTIALTIKKTIDPQDWSPYKYLSLYIKTENIQHGDVYFYLRDSNPGILNSGIQNSYQIVLPRNTPTINNDSLENGWQQVIIDISSFNRQFIDTIAFSISSQDGWDTSKSFDFNVDQISLLTGSIYETNGYINFVFGDISTLFDFNFLRWDYVLPADSEYVGATLVPRVRFSPDQITWSEWESVPNTPSSSAIPTSGLNNFIQVQFNFTSSDSRIRTPYLRRLYLDYVTNGTINNVTFDTKEDFETGNLYNIDTATTHGTIQISNVQDLGTYYYAGNGFSTHANSFFEDVQRFIGSDYPVTTHQALNSLPPSLGMVTSINRGNNGNMWLADIDNDRIIETDAFGNFVRGFYSSFIKSMDVVSVDTTSIITPVPTTSTGLTINVLHSSYNMDKGILYIIFDSNLENIYLSTTRLDKSKIYLKVNSQIVTISSSASFELLGIDKAKYNLWNPIFSTTLKSSTGITQDIVSSSNVLKITLNGSDKTFFNYLIDSSLPMISIVSPYAQQRVYGTSITIATALKNFVLGSGSGNSIRIRIDGGAWITIYTTTYTFSGLSNGLHTVDVQLVDTTSTPITTIGSSVQSSFVVSGSYSLPYLSILSPKCGQVYSTGNAYVDFKCENFPIIRSGQHVRYVVDSNPPIDYYSTEPIQIDNIDHGQHTITIYTVDKNGNTLVYDYGSVSASFVVGLNPEVITKLYIDYGAIYDNTLTKPVASSRIYIDIANVTYSNIYSPIDIKILPKELGSNGEPTIIIAKMHTPSWNDILGDASVATTMTGTSIDTSLVVDETIANGYTVVQMDMDGNVVSSNNIAKFSDTKENAKIFLGSVSKNKENEILIGDSINKKAIIVDVNSDTKISKTIWEYNSDRNVVDFCADASNSIQIDISDDSVSEQYLFVKNGTTVTWVNKSSQPVLIYSGTTTADKFAIDPDLSLYGDVFASTSIPSQGTFTFRFDSNSRFDWFVYPYIFVGSIIVSENKIPLNDKFYILESGNDDAPYSSRLIKVDTWGNIIYSYGEGYIVKPRDVRSYVDGRVLIST